jgi:hypothetical protein
MINRLFLPAVMAILSFPVILSFGLAFKVPIAELIMNEIRYPCQFLAAYKMPCATCGLTRAWIQISQGNFDKAMELNSNAITTYFAVIAAIFTIILNYAPYFRRFRMPHLTIAALIILIAWIPIISANFKLYARVL